MPQYLTPTELRTIRTDAKKQANRNRGNAQTRPALNRKPGDVIQVKLLEELDGGGEADAVCCWPDDHADPEEKKFKVKAWWPSGSLAEDKRGFCVWWAGEWYMIAPEECPS